MPSDKNQSAFRQPTAGRPTDSTNGGGSTSSHQPNDQHPSLYAAPTTSTLGDEEGAYVPQTLVRPYQAQTPTKYRRPLEHNNGSKSTPTSSTSTRPRNPSTASTVAARSRQSPTSTNATSAQQPSERKRAPSRRPSSGGASPNNNNTNRDFQFDTDFPSVTVRHVNVQQRSAFDVKALTPLTEWLRIAARTKKRRLSPAYAHLELLHKLQQSSNSSMVRQVQFSPSTGREADYFYASHQQVVATDGENSADEILLPPRYRRRRDGRYRSIDPLAAFRAACCPGAGDDDNETLPPPTLSHKKYRLPNRADVGFPNAAPADIQRKQQEIRHETAWEEASPRLVVLVTSDDLGTSSEQQPQQQEGGGGGRSSSSGGRRQQQQQPNQQQQYAGRDLLLAKARNAEQFGRRQLLETMMSTIDPKSLLPNPYSMLAPPLDSTFSPSQGWRPRAFHDRPAGMSYCLACPMEFSFSAAATDAAANTTTSSQMQEPLVCSLALYTLPPLYRDKQYISAAAAAAYHCKKQGTVPAYGKMSEEFWFPAGDWRGKVEHLPAVQTQDGAVDEELLAAWLERKHKAIFSFDWLDLAMESKKSSSPDPSSIFVVLHVYKVVTPLDVDQAASEQVFEQYGTQLLAPISFGVTKFFSSKGSMNWPNGQVKDMQLYTYPDKAESQELFVERLWGVVYQKYASPTTPHYQDDGASAASLSKAGEDSLSVTTMETTDTTRRKGLANRLFRSPKPSRSKTPVPSITTPKPTHLRQRSVSTGSLTSVGQNSTTLGAPPVSEPTDWSVRLFLSSLSADFLQSLLVSPRELDGKTTNGHNKKLPQLLVDISGDFAVLVDRAESIVPAAVVQESQGSAVSKRSNLLRLPPPVEPAGYCGASEFREVLYLPARPERHYDVDSHIGSCRSILNLLYLYPRLLRRSPEAPSHQDLSDFTVRIRLVHTETIVDEETEKSAHRSAPISCFHNSVPWAGTGLMDSIYTKIPSGSGFTGDIGSGIPIRDEIKVRLPDVLDGNYHVEFTLLSVQKSAEGEVSLDHVAEASVPLSSSSSPSRDGSVGSRVTTIIPNGKHRLELGGFQLHLETRLVSSIHVGDPAVATALRDLQTPKAMLSKPTDLLLGNSTHSSSSVDMSSSPSPHLLAFSSESTVAGYFQVLLYMHLFDLLQSNDGVALEADSLVRMMGRVQSLFEVLRKVKAKFKSTGELETDSDRIQKFFKRNLDSFDEAYLSERHRTSQVEEADDEAEIQEDEFENDLVGEAREDFAVSWREKSLSQRHLDSRASRIEAALGPAGVPFSRVAYGATKTDRMRVEAEIRHNGTHFMPFFDDDETIATAQSLHSGPIAKQGVTRIEGPLVTGLPDDANSIEGTRSTNSALIDEKQYAIGDTEFAKRMRTAAKVMLAPCVAPSLSEALSKCGPRSTRPDVKAKKQPTFLEPEEKAEGYGGGLVGPMAWFCAPGSDAEDDTDASYPTRPGQKHESVPMLKYRNLLDEAVLSFSVKSGADDDVAVGRGKFVYETIIVLWLRAWLDHVEGSFRKPSIHTGRQTTTFDVPYIDPSVSQPEGNEPIFSFYAHLDFLLPLCLKSIVMRYSEDVMSRYPPGSKVMLDEGHLRIFEPFVEMLARGLVGQALSGMSSAEAREVAIQRALESSDVVLDFLIGLFSVLHAEHMRILLTNYFAILLDTETEHLGDNINVTNFEWTDENLHRVRCSRKLRLRGIEKLAVLPSFLAVNYPMKFSRSIESLESKKTTWLKQYNDIDPDSPSSIEDSLVENGVEKLPHSGWLARLIIVDSLSVCALSCEAVVAEAIAQIEVSSQHGSPTKDSSLTKRPGASLKRADLLMFQAMGIQAIEIVYELIVRRQAMDRRFQTDSARSRIAGLLARPILEKSVASVRWLARMEATHKVRSSWLLSFAYVLQEAPEVLIRDFVQSCCHPEDFRIHRFIRLLRLCTSTFQGFLDLHHRSYPPSEADETMSPWLLQESFNTICASTNIVVEVCVGIMSSYPDEQRKAMRGILDLLLHVLTTPQSSVTHLRAVGGALQALEFDVDLFLEATGANFQHWVRIILSLMNSISLSVRSIAVDFVVSLLGSTFKLHGSISALSLIFSSVLPEVVAREIALYSVSGHISSFDDIAKSVWPIRRSIADLQDTNPLDDDRVDPQLSPIISVLCRAWQAIVDGVLLELRLQEGGVIVVGTEIEATPPESTTFDAEEESLFEAASFFVPETAPMQKIRWLLTLKSLHEAKQQWVEAAETLFLCARTICAAIPHLKNIWRPSRFALWSDSRHSLWLETVGEDVGHPDRGNAEVMDFADHFLEPASFLGTVWKPANSTSNDKLRQPTIAAMCTLLTEVAKEAVGMYLKEDGMDEIAYSRLEKLLKVLMSVVEDHSALPVVRSTSRPMSFMVRKRQVEEEASLRKVSASISGDMTKLAERLLSLVENEKGTADVAPLSRSKRPCYVLLRLYGKKPPRFQESTTIPTFLEWEKPCICRVPKDISDGPSDAATPSMENICVKFAAPYLTYLSQEIGKSSVVLRTSPSLSNASSRDDKTYVDVIPVEGTGNDPFQLSLASKRSKHFVHRKEPSTLVETTVAKEFPCALSRQSSLLTTEIVSTRTPSSLL